MVRDRLGSDRDEVKNLKWCEVGWGLIEMRSTILGLEKWCEIGWGLIEMRLTFLG